MWWVRWIEVFEELAKDKGLIQSLSFIFKCGDQALRVNILKSMILTNNERRRIIEYTKEMFLFLVRVDFLVLVWNATLLESNPGPLDIRAELD